MLVLACLIAATCVPKGDVDRQVLEPSALADPPRELPLEVEGAEIVIREGTFEAERYTIQGGRIRIRFRTIGGPYTLTIDRYVAGPQALAANSTTEVGFVANEPGDLTMTVSETGSRATLTIRGPTSR